MTLGIDIGVIKMIITHAAALRGLDISPEPVDLARVALKRLGLIGKGTERDRRPSTDELNRLFRCFDDNERLTLPMNRRSLASSCRARMSQLRRRIGASASSRASSARPQHTCGSFPRHWPGSTCNTG